MTNPLFLLIAAAIGALAVVASGWLARWLSGFFVPEAMTRHTGFAFVLGGWAATGINSNQTAPEMAVYVGGVVGLVVVWWWFFRRGVTGRAVPDPSAD